ncbi:Uncharacterised protein [Aeromonas encheleia]|uniref:hypothetical protein n=1 Tax=Aeromonas encheleia TaxID=73010 RepID=UPI0005B1DDF2|nr:hypothetical protein [Aeromonas encheleia]VEG95464.1 Uncharacterised protein [Aeromonas encheleia]
MSHATDEESILSIRAQYHFRPAPEGLLAWDVRRLVRLSRTLPVRSLPLLQIAELDSEHWYGHGSVRPTVRSIAEHCQLMLAADLAYPIILDSAGRVMDGMHRVSKALMQGRTHIDAVQFVLDPAPDHTGCDPDSLPYDD